MRILVVSAHPDDETLGCGGTLLKHGAAGDTLFWLIVTQAHEPQWPGEVIKQKATEVERVSHAYGMDGCIKLGLPTVRLDTVPQAELMDRTQEALSKINPDLVYLVHGGDVHSDHQAVFKAAMSVLKPFHMGHLGVRRVLCYETLSSTEAAPPHMDNTFVPTVLNDITPHLERKMEIMDLYQTEIHTDPLPRGPSAIRSLARYRGAAIGVEYAEAFMLIRELM